MNDRPTRRITNPNAATQRVNSPRRREDAGFRNDGSPPTRARPLAWSEDEVRGRSEVSRYYEDARYRYSEPAVDQDSYAENETVPRTRWFQSLPMVLVVIAVVAVISAGGGLAYTMMSSTHTAPKAPQSPAPAVVPQQNQGGAPAQPAGPTPPPTALPTPSPAQGSVPNGGGGPVVQSPGDPSLNAPNQGPPAPALAPAQGPVDPNQQQSGPTGPSGPAGVTGPGLGTTGATGPGHWADRSDGAGDRRDRADRSDGAGDRRDRADRSDGAGDRRDRADRSDRSCREHRSDGSRRRRVGAGHPVPPEAATLLVVPS